MAFIWNSFFGKPKSSEDTPPEDKSLKKKNSSLPTGKRSLEDEPSSSTDKRTHHVVSQTMQTVSSQSGGTSVFTTRTITTTTTTYSSRTVSGQLEQNSPIFAASQAMRLLHPDIGRPVTGHSHIGYPNIGHPSVGHSGIGAFPVAKSRKTDEVADSESSAKKHRKDMGRAVDREEVKEPIVTSPSLTEEKPIVSKGKKRRVSSEESIKKSEEKPLNIRISDAVTQAIVLPMEEKKEPLSQEIVTPEAAVRDDLDDREPKVAKKRHIEVQEPEIEKSETKELTAEVTKEVTPEAKEPESIKKRHIDIPIEEPKAKKNTTVEPVVVESSDITPKDVINKPVAADVSSEKTDTTKRVSKKRSLKASLSGREIKYQKESSPPPSPASARKFFLAQQKSVNELTDKIVPSMPGVARDDIVVFSRFLNASAEKKYVLDALDRSDPETIKQTLKYALLKAISYASSDSNVEVYSKILKTIDPLPTFTPEVVSAKHIAIVFGDSFTQTSGFEGDYDGTPYGRLVVDFLKSVDAPNPELQKILENAISVPSFSESTDGSLKEAIKKRFDAGQKKCLIYGGWADHSIVYEVEKQPDGKYAFRVFNEGSGVNFHKSSVSRYREKYDGCLSVKDIPEHLLFKSELLGCLQGLVHIKSSDNPAPGELLARHIFPMLDGNKDLVPPDVQQMLSPQRSGTCIYRSLQTFIANQHTQKDYKLFKCRFKNFLLNKYLPQLRRAGGKKIETSNEYIECRKDYAAIKRSVEKYAASIEKIALDSSSEEGPLKGEVKKLETTLLEYKAALVEFEKRIIDFEKSLYPPAQFTELTTSPLICKIPAFKPARLVSDTEISWDSSISGHFKGKSLELLKDINNLNLSDPKFSKIVEKTINELANVPHQEGTSIYTSQSIYLFDLLCRKLGGVSGWEKVHFENPSLGVQSLTKIIRSLASETDKNTSAELHGILCLFSVGLERAFTLWNEKEKMLQKPFLGILSEHLSFEKMQSSDPFWREQFIQFKRIFKSASCASVPYAKNELTGTVGRFSPEITLGAAIGKWLEKPEQMDLQRKIQESVKKDRELMKKIVDDQIAKDKIRIKELEPLRYKGSSLDQEIVSKEIEQCQIRINSGITRLRDNEQFWPHGFLDGESPRASSEYKGLFLLSRGAFFESKLGKEDLLPKEFRSFLDTGVLLFNILNQEKRLLQGEMPIFPKQIETESNCWPTDPAKLLFVYDKSFAYNSKLTPADQYAESLKEPSVKRLYNGFREVDSIATARKYDQTAFLNEMPEIYVHLIADDIAKEGDIGIDECKDIISIAATPHVLISSLMNYCSQHREKLLDNDYFNLFHSMLFSSDHLFNELQNNKTSPLLIDAMRSLFSSIVAEALELGDYSTCANILWLAGNVQKYIDIAVVGRIEAPLVSDEIYEKLFLAAADPKNMDAVPVIMESILASSEKILSNPPKTPQEKRLFSRACMAYSLRQRYPILSDRYCLPRRQQADQAILKLQHTLSLDGVEEKNIVDVEYLSSYLGKFFPPFSGSTLVWDKAVCYLQKSGTTIGNFSLSLGMLQPTDPKMLRLFDNPLPDAILKLLKVQNLFPEGHQYKEMRCYFENGICYIHDKKTDKYLQIAVSDEGSFDIYVRINAAGGSAWAKFIPIQKREYTEQFLELKNGYHHIQLGKEIILCSSGFKEEYRISASGTIHPIEKSKLHVIMPPEKLVFSAFEDPKCTTYLADEKDQLQEVRFSRLGMAVEQSDGKWLLKGQPEWSLAKEQFLPHFGHETGFLIFENAKGEKKVYLPIWGPAPARNIPGVEKSTQRSLHFPYEYDFESKDKRTGTCAEYAIQAGVVVPTTAQARYQLARIYLEKGYSDEAAELLFSPEALMTSRKLSNEAELLLRKLVLTPASQDIGSQNIKLRLHAFYILEKNRELFPDAVRKTPTAEEKETIHKLYISYLSRLGHIKPLEANEELLILSYLQSTDSRLTMRKRELSIEDPGAEMDVSMEEASSEVETASIIRISNTRHVLPTTLSANSSLQLPKYQHSRKTNEFPFNPAKVAEWELGPYLYPLYQECKKTISWKEACDNGLAQAVFCMSLSKDNAVREYALQLYTALIDKTAEPSPFPKNEASGGFFGALQGLTTKLFTTTKIPAESTIMRERQESSTLIQRQGRVGVAVKPNIQLLPRPLQGLAKELPGLASIKIETLPEASFQDYFTVESKTAVPTTVSAVSPFDLKSAIANKDSITAEKFKQASHDLDVAISSKEIHYILNDGKDLGALKREVEEKEMQARGQLAEIEEQIVSSVTTSLIADPIAHMQFISGVRSLPSIEDLCVLCGRSQFESFCKKQLPGISDEGRARLLSSIKAYLIVKKEIQLSERVLANINTCLTTTDKSLKRTLTTAIAKELLTPSSNREKFSENEQAMFLFLETVLNISLRDDQIKSIHTLKKRVQSGDSKSLVLQMIMGAGKTSVLQPILAIFFSNSESLSVVDVPEAQYAQVADGLSKALGRSFKQQVFAAKFDRNLAKDTAYLDTFYNNLIEAKERGACFLRSPRIKHVINASLAEAYHDVNNDVAGSKERLERIIRIGNFLQLHENVQIDEIDLAMNPNVVFKNTIGEATPVDVERASLLSELLINFSLQAATEVPDFASAFKERIGQKEHGVPWTEQAYQGGAKKQLISIAHELLKKKIPKFTDIEKTDKEKYLEHFLSQTTPFDKNLTKVSGERRLVIEKGFEDAMDKSGYVASLKSKDENEMGKHLLFKMKSKEWINREISEPYRDLLAVAAIAIDTILPSSFSKECGAHYGRDTQEGKYAARPYDAPKAPKTSSYGNVYEQVVYSTQQALYYGIPADASKKMLLQLQVFAKQDLEEGKKLNDSDAYKKFVSIIGEKNAAKTNFFENPLSEKTLKLFLDCANTNPGILLEFLQKYTFPQIKQYSLSASSTPQTLAGSSRIACGYTGTMSTGILPRKVKAKPEEGTDGKTILAIQEKMRTGKATVDVFDEQKGPALLTQMSDRFKEDKNLFVFIDSGGWLKETSSKSYAKELLKTCSDRGIEGVVYHNDVGELVCLEKQDSGELDEVPLNLAKNKSNSGKVLTIIAQKYETGTNIAQAPLAKAVMTIRKKMTKRDGLQSAFRMRQILQGQSVSFALSKEVEGHLRASGIEKASSEGIWQYLTFNEAQEEQDKNWLAAKQRMREVVEKPIRMALLDSTIPLDSRRSLFAATKSLFIDSLVDSPFNSLTSQREPIDSSVAVDLEIAKYVEFLDKIPVSCSKEINETIQKFGLEEGISGAATDIIKAMLKECVSLKDIPARVDPFARSEGSEVEQEEEVEIEQEQEVQIEVAAPIKEKNPYIFLTGKYDVMRRYTKEDLTRSLLLFPSLYNKSSLKLQGSDKLEISPNVTPGGNPLGSSDNASRQVSWKYMCIISKSATEKRYIMVSDTDAQRIKAGLVPEIISTKYPSVSVVDDGGNPLVSTLPVEECKKLKNDAELGKMLILAKLSQGKTGYSKKELDTIEKELLASDAIESSAVKAGNLQKFYESVIRFMPSAYSRYRSGNLKKLFTKLSEGK